jgi:ubiquinone/menaquinone biosynthesis C-methylase UbiE
MCAILAVSIEVSLMSREEKPSTLIRWTPSLYNRISKFYDLVATLLFPIGKRGHLRILDGISKGCILDVACGTGSLLKLASLRGLSCYGLDTSAGMLSIAKRKVPEAMLRMGSFYEMPFPDKSFDYVVETNAVSGVEIDVGQVIGEMIRVCKCGGEIRIADYTKSPRPTILNRMLERVLVFVGDFAYDYVKIFRDLGYQAEVEKLGWNGMYQFIRIQKTS